MHRELLLILPISKLVVALRNAHQDARPMTKHARCGTLILTFDLNGLHGDHAGRANDACMVTVDALLSLLREARMPATWASPAPAACHAVTEILAETIGHEIAVRPAAEPGKPIVVARVMRQISQQLEQAQRSGYTVTTLLIDSTPESNLLQACCRAGFSAVAVSESIRPTTNWLNRLQQFFSLGHSAPPQPRLQRYGLWEISAGVSLPCNQSASRLHRMVREAAACGDVLHASVDVQQLHAGRAGGLKRLEALLQAAFDLRSERQLAIRTVADMVDRLRDQRGSKPAKSILRAA